MSHQQLNQLDLRLKEIMCDDRRFRGCAVVLFGDPGKLPPARANSLRIGMYQGTALAGYMFHTDFTVVTC